MDDLKKIKLESCKARLAAYYKAEGAILLGKSYKMGTMYLERANLAEVRSAIERLEREIAILQRGGKRRAMQVIPRDL